LISLSLLSHPRVVDSPVGWGQESWGPKDQKKLRVTGWEHRPDQFLGESFLEIKKPLSRPLPTQRPPTAPLGVPCP